MKNNDLAFEADSEQELQDILETDIDFVFNPADEYICLLADNIPEILVRIFGKGFDYSFYEQRALQLATLLGSKNINVRELAESAKASNTENYLTTDFEELDNFRYLFSQSEFNHVDLTEILYVIVNLDKRLSLTLLYYLGFFPWILSHVEFMQFFGVSKHFTKAYPSIALQQLTVNLQNFDNVNYDHKVKVVQSFLSKILSLDSNDLLKFSDDTFIPLDSVLYKFAQIIFFQKRIKLRLLSYKEKQIYTYYKKFFKENGKFPATEFAAAQLGLDATNFNRYMKGILQVANPENSFIRNTEGDIRMLDSEDVMYKILKLYSKDLNFDQNPNLSQIQRKTLNAAKEAVSNLTGAIPSTTLIGNRIGLSQEQVYYHLNSALEKLNDYVNYYDKDGTKLRPDDVRVQLITLGGLKYIKTLGLRPVNEQILALLLQLQDKSRTFKYSYEEVAAKFGINAKNNFNTLRSLIANILNGENDFNPTLVDQAGIPLSKNHLIVVELLLKHGIDAVANIKPEHYLDIAKAILETDENGRYKSLKKIGEDLFFSKSVIPEAAKKIIIWLQNIES